MLLHQLAIATIMLHNKLPQIQWHKINHKHFILVLMGPQVSWDLGWSASLLQVLGQLSLIPHCGGGWVCSTHMHSGTQATWGKFFSQQWQSTRHLSNLFLCHEC